MGSAVLAFGIGRALRRPMPSRGYVRQLLAYTGALVERGSQAALVLRFIPLLPFTVFNIALGRARIGWWTFLWTTALGILPATVTLVAIGYGATAVHSMFLWGASALAGLITAGLTLRRLAAGRSAVLRTTWHASYATGKRRRGLTSFQASRSLGTPASFYKRCWIFENWIELGVAGTCSSCTRTTTASWNRNESACF